MFAFARFLLRRRVIVNLDDGTAISGIAYKAAGPLLVLKKAELLLAGTEPTPLDGDTVIERDRVLFIQAP
ncbi:hypothetical protein [Microcella alkaliphila]|uniref:Uncharacterized protein n=1 Tax=Microcella alkaliphila TaxID=279828 RepID=A0A0U5BCU4_9MICO|nr:hypothetical protein [Microcella alkaliphila]BAU32465.1 uncharacterized protein MalAC0309_1614 [Microcella alkaliphila]